MTAARLPVVGLAALRSGSLAEVWEALLEPQVVSSDSRHGWHSCLRADKLSGGVRPSVLTENARSRPRRVSPDRLGLSDYLGDYRRGRPRIPVDG
jgi:hypothetical protein